MKKISISTTVKIVVTEEASKEEEISTGASVAAEKRVTRMLLVGTTQRIQSKSHKGIRKMEGIVRKLD